MMNKMAGEFWKVKSTHLKFVKVVKHWANILYILLIDGPNCIQLTDFFSLWDQEAEYHIQSPQYSSALFKGNTIQEITFMKNEIGAYKC